jgi:hypothetical protein
MLNDHGIQSQAGREQTEGHQRRCGTIRPAVWKNLLPKSKLDAVLPLMLAEMARVLRPRTGRMVLLCGSHVPILEALYQATNNGKNYVWTLPCTAVFPVNIGGLQAWVIRVKRGSDGDVPTATHKERVRQLTRKRERNEQLKKNGAHSKLMIKDPCVGGSDSGWLAGSDRDQG